MTFVFFGKCCFRCTKGFWITNNFKFFIFEWKCSCNRVFHIFFLNEKQFEWRLFASISYVQILSCYLILLMSLPVFFLIYAFIIVMDEVMASDSCCSLVLEKCKYLYLMESFLLFDDYYSCKNKSNRSAVNEAKTFFLESRPRKSSIDWLF